MTATNDMVSATARRTASRVINATRDSRIAPADLSAIVAGIIEAEMSRPMCEHRTVDDQVVSFVRPLRGDFFTTVVPVTLPPDCYSSPTPLTVAAGSLWRCDFGQLDSECIVFAVPVSVDGSVEMLEIEVSLQDFDHREQVFTALALADTDTVPMMRVACSMRSHLTGIVAMFGGYDRDDDPTGIKRRQIDAANVACTVLETEVARMMAAVADVRESLRVSHLDGWESDRAMRVIDDVLTKDYNGD